MSKPFACILFINSFISDAQSQVIRDARYNNKIASSNPWPISRRLETSLWYRSSMNQGRIRQRRERTGLSYVLPKTLWASAPHLLQPLDYAGGLYLYLSRPRLIHDSAAHSHSIVYCNILIWLKSFKRGVKLISSSCHDSHRKTKSCQYRCTQHRRGHATALIRLRSCSGWNELLLPIKNSFLVTIYALVLKC